MSIRFSLLEHTHVLFLGRKIEFPQVLDPYMMNVWYGKKRVTSYELKA